MYSTKTNGGSRFPDGWRQNKLCHSASFLPKSAWKWKKLNRGGGGRIPRGSLRTANDNSQVIQNGKILHLATFLCPAALLQPGTCLFCWILCQFMHAFIDFLIALQWDRSHLLGEKQPKFTETSTSLVRHKIIAKIPDSWIYISHVHIRITVYDRKVD